MAAPAPAQPSSLADWLRQRSDEQLAELLRRRPDLALPAPPDLVTLGNRLGARSSVQRAVDSLDGVHLRVLEALVLHRRDPGELLGRTLDVRPILDDLRAVGLIWGPDEHVRLVNSVVESLGPYPAGLGRPLAVLLPAVSDVVLARVLRALGLPPATQPRSAQLVAHALSTRLPELLDALDAEERDVLDRLAAGPPVGTIRNAQAVMADGMSGTPPQRLVARGLLVPIDVQAVELPREIGLALRGEQPLGTVLKEAPAMDAVQRGPAELDRAGTTAVLDTLRLVDALADSWTRQPPPTLRTGGLGVRQLTRTARDLGVHERVAALIVETSYAAGLIGPTPGMEPVFLPTTDYDTWHEQESAQRWTSFAGAWLAMTRQPALVGDRGERDRVITALSPDAERGTLPALRASVLGVLAELRPGAVPASRAAVLDRLAWRAPRRAGAQRPLAEAVLTEADLLAVTAAGGLTGYGRALLAGSPDAARQAVTAALPEPVDFVLVQPDLTVVVPGPPSPALAADLAAAADIESNGGASVYRVTERTIRRALDRGRSGAELTTLFAERSRTPVPQALTYLIDDVARRHGVLRSGPASSYLRSDDEALLDRAVSDRALDALQLRRLAPTVIVSGAPVARVLDLLREAGYAPAAESADGIVLALDAEAPRAPSRNGPRIVRPRPAADSPGQLADIVRRMRAGDALVDRPLLVDVQGVTTATNFVALREAIRNSSTLLVRVAEDDGRVATHILLPLSLGGGMLRGHDLETRQMRSIPLHRLTAATVVEEDES